jgi:dihydroorotase
MERGELVRGTILFLFVILCQINSVSAQDIDILLKGGHLIDPKNRIDSKLDVAILDGKIFQVDLDIPVSKAKKVIDVTGLFITPGLIDIHVHVFAGTKNFEQASDGPVSLPPDGFTFRSGVTTVVDAGSPGWKNFPTFKRNIIDQSKTRVLAFLNIVGDGMGENQQDTTDMDPEMAATFAKYYSKYIVGFKVAHFGGAQSIPVDSAVAASNLADMPVMIDWRGLPPLNSLETLLLKSLRPGDILTHNFHAGKSAGATSPFYKESIVDENGKVKPYVIRAQQRGIVFDVGHGANGFVFSQAVPAIEQGFVPNSISSDLHVGNMNQGQKDMANIMSKFMNMGMPLYEVILRSTWNPAKYIKRPELGHLSVGAEADIAVFTVKTGNFGFFDAHGGFLKGTQKLETELTLMAGKIEWDLNGIGIKVYDAK